MENNWYKQYLFKNLKLISQLLRYIIIKMLFALKILGKKIEKKTFENDLFFKFLIF